MWKYLDDKVIKTAIGSFFAYIITDYFGIKYGLTASLVALISIQATKADSIKVTLERVFAVFLGVPIFVLLTYIFGFKYITLGLFILLFMPLCNRFDIKQGFLVTVVLGTHILTEKSITPKFLLNEFYILLIGLFIGNILNLYMPINTVKIKKIKRKIDEQLKKILYDMEKTLRYNYISIDEDKNFIELERLITQGKRLALLDYGNSLFDKSHKELDFFNMRYTQFRSLKRIRRCFSKIYITYTHSILIAELMVEIANVLSSEYDVTFLLNELEKLNKLFREMPLPKTRSEFENRAILYQILGELEEFLEAKYEYQNKKDIKWEKM